MPAVGLRAVRGRRAGLRPAARPVGLAWGHRREPARAPALSRFTWCRHVGHRAKTGESGVVVEEVSAGVRDVGSARQSGGADRQVAEAGHRSGRGTRPDLGVVFSEGCIADPVQPVFHPPV